MLPTIHERLFITRSFSKAYGLAALRIGWITCCEDEAKYLEDIRYPWRIGRMACIAAIAAVNDQSWLAEVVRQTNRTKDYVEDQLKGYNFVKSSANYIMLYTYNLSSKVCDKLREKGFIVRDLQERVGRGAIRFAIHKKDVMERFVRDLKQVLVPKCWG